MKNLIKTILIVFLIIGVFFFLIFIYLDNKIFSGSPSFQKNFSRLESLTQQKEEQFEYKEFVTPDENLKFKYPSNWTEIKDKEPLEKNIPKEAEEKYEFKNLFYAFKVRGQNFYNLIVSEGIFGSEKNFEEIVSIIKEINKNDGVLMEIEKIEIKENECVFEANYKKEKNEDDSFFSSKEKIFEKNLQEDLKKVYFISFLSYGEKIEESLKEEMVTLFESVEFNY